MEFNFDHIYIINLILCIIILFLGYKGYRKNKSLFPLYVGLGFGLFGLSHLEAILGLRADLEIFLIIIRLLGYLMVILALYKYLKK